MVSALLFQVQLHHGPVAQRNLRNFSFQQPSSFFPMWKAYIKVPFAKKTIVEMTNWLVVKGGKVPIQWDMFYYL